MKNKYILIIFLLIILGLSLLKPARAYWKAFFVTLFSKEIIVYENIPASNDPKYRVLRNGQFKSEELIITRVDSIQYETYKESVDTTLFKIKWVNENEYLLFNSYGSRVLRAKIINLTDSSYTCVYQDDYKVERMEFTY